ncbi:MAG: iron chelate uptake ABC transporter family permease subunit, partial [Marinicaulis sp.]|nr:iron chelate uptake ABC transporter family permease subunit [Marinicaulis sp.]
MLIGALTAASLVVIFFACLLGSTPMSPGRVLAVLFGGGSVGDQIVIWQIRLPRALAAFIVGAALGASGASLQGLLRNPLAEPGILGVSAMASLGATFSLYYGLTTIWAYALPFAAIIGAL